MNNVQSLLEEWEVAFVYNIVEQQRVKELY